MRAAHIRAEHRKTLHVAVLLLYCAGKQCEPKPCELCAYVARLQVLTDCDDSALAILKEMNLPDMFHVHHHLWEQDEHDESIEAEHAARVAAAGTVDSEASAPAVGSGPHYGAPVRHCSDGSRLREAFQPMVRGDTFDLVIASDCLYFTQQEAPLAAVLRKRCVPCPPHVSHMHRALPVCLLYCSGCAAVNLYLPLIPCSTATAPCLSTCCLSP